MKRSKLSYCAGLVCAGLLAVALAACQNTPAGSSEASVTPTPTPVSTFEPIRINAGAYEDVKDSKGVTWKADVDFSGGSEMDRTGSLEITGTDAPEVYYTERYSMDSYSIKVPNGKYTLKLHFSEDYEGVTDADGRIFDFTVKDGDAAAGKVVKTVTNFGPWKASGAQYKAYVETIPVTVTNGMISITFTPNVENPQINAIEILPG